jgi:parallel beta-helix repeat protein
MLLALISSSLERGWALKKLASCILLAMLSMSMFTFAFNVEPIRAQSQTIHINPDGSISSPVPANITTSDKVTYTFTGNNYLPIVVNRSNIIINGRDHTLQAPGQNAFYLESVNSVTIKNTTITNSRIGIYLASSSSNVLSGNNVTANSYSGIYLACSDNNTLYRNNVTANTIGGIWLDYSSDNNVLSGNSFTANDYDIFISRSSDNNTLYSNDVTAGWYGGIYLTVSSDNNTLVDNSITTTSGYGDSITLDSSSDNNVLSGNKITGKPSGGISLGHSSSGNVLSGNNITGTNGGIDIYSSSDNNVLSGNNIAGNLDGIYVYDCSGNVLSGNNITASPGTGIILSSCSGNMIYHNNFVSNNRQTYIVGSTNGWDDGYPFGGNYWSDYSAVDQKNGPFQNLTGSDGIGDAPYVIDSNNKDNYPLTYPWPSHEVAITSAAPSKTVVVEGNDLNINVTVANLGDYTETFNVTLSGSQYRYSWPIYAFTDIKLAPRSTVTLTLVGLGFGVGSYTLSARVYNAYVSNTYTGPTVLVAPIASFRPWSWMRPIPV